MHRSVSVHGSGANWCLGPWAGSLLRCFQVSQGSGLRLSSGCLADVLCWLVSPGVGRAPGRPRSCEFLSSRGCLDHEGAGRTGQPGRTVGTLGNEARPPEGQGKDVGGPGRGWALLPLGGDGRVAVVAATWYSSGPHVRCEVSKWRWSAHLRDSDLPWAAQHVKLRSGLTSGLGPAWWLGDLSYLGPQDQALHLSASCGFWGGRASVRRLM